MSIKLSCPHCSNVLFPVKYGYKCTHCNSKFYSFSSKYKNSKCDRNYIQIVNEDGTTEKVELIITFEFKDDHKEFVVYNKGEKDNNGNCIVYISSIERNSGELPSLGRVNERDWIRVKHVINELSKSSE